MLKHTGTITAALLLTLSAVPGSLAAQSPALPGHVVSAGDKTVLPVLERFRTYSGKRTADDLIRLFTAEAAGVKQFPPVALSDGKTKVLLRVSISIIDNRAPNLAFVNAAKSSIKHLTADVWEVEALPEPGTVQAAVLLSQGSGTRTIPLTVAPPLPKGKDLSLKGFAAYLRHSEADPKQRLDLNGDGRTDYLDDYILAANVLVASSADPHDPGARNRRARAQTPVRK